MVGDVESGTRDLRLYFVIAYVLSWLCWLPMAFSTKEVTKPPITFYLAAFGPFTAALSLTYLNEGREGAKKLLEKGLFFGFEKAWLVPILLFSPAIGGVALLLSVLTGGTAPDLIWLSDPSQIVTPFLGYLILAVGEEFGWRGYALPRFQRRHSAVVSSLILGLLWGAWHLPLFLIGGSLWEGTPAWSFMVTTMSLSILFTWIYNNTGGSLLAVTLFHATHNLSAVLFPSLKTAGGALYASLLYAGSLILIVVYWGHRSLVRG